MEDEYSFWKASHEDWQTSILTKHSIIRFIEEQYGLNTYWGEFFVRFLFTKEAADEILGWMPGELG